MNSYITVLLYEGEGISISHPLKSDGDGHRLPPKVREQVAATLLLDHWMMRLLDSYIIIIFLSIILTRLHVNIPPVRTRSSPPL